MGDSGKTRADRVARDEICPSFASVMPVAKDASAPIDWLRRVSVPCGGFGVR
jgi:hypothetical protein